MTLTYRSTAGRRLTVTEGDGNIAHLAAADGITFVQSGTAPISRTMQAKGRETASAKDDIGETYGADDTTAFQQRITDEASSTGREILVNAGTLITTGVTLPGTSAQQVSLRGDPQTKIKAKAGASVVVQVNDDITRTGFREIKSLKIDGADIASVTGIKVGTTTSAALQVYLRSIDVRDCATGIDLYSSMENSCTDVVCYSNTIGMKFRQDATNGGGNANRFDGLRLQENTIGLVIDADSALPMGNNQFNQPLVQSNTLCGIAMIGVDEGMQFNAGHFEANASAGTTLVVDGNTIEKSVLFMDDSIATFSESTFSEASANPCIILRTGSRLILRNSGGYGLASGTFIDGSLAESVEFYGYCVLAGKIKVNVDRWPDSYLASSTQWSGTGIAIVKETNTLPNTFATNPYAPLLQNAAGATINADVGDSQMGIVSNVTYLASAGSTSANRVVIDAFLSSITSGDTWVVSFLAKASAACNMTFAVTDGTYADHVTALDTKWRRIVIAFRAGTTNTPLLYCYPNDSVGATVSFSHLHSLRIASGGDMSQAYAMVREGLFNNNQYEFVYSAAPTVGTWKVGDRVWNTAPAAAGTPGWVCTTAGTPGTWKAMAVLAA